VATGFFDSAWPDLITGVGIAALNAGAAREVWEAARSEQREASA
jgi:Co/Zn/Cd efflux system component